MPVSTLGNRPHTALVVIDVQVDVVARAHDRDQVVANIATLVEAARKSDRLVVWVADHESLPIGSDGWNYVPELLRQETEPLVHKLYRDAFEDTELESVLAERGVGRLVVAGAQTEECVRSTLHGAVVRGYDTILVSDAHTTEDLSAYGAPTAAQVIAHTNLSWSRHRAPGRTVGTVTTAEVDFGA